MIDDDDDENDDHYHDIADNDENDNNNFDDDDVMMMIMMMLMMMTITFMIMMLIKNVMMMMTTVDDDPLSLTVCYLEHSLFRMIFHFPSFRYKVLYRKIIRYLESRYYIIRCLEPFPISCGEKTALYLEHNQIFC